MFSNSTRCKCIVGFDPKAAVVHGEEWFLKHSLNEREGVVKTVENFRKRRAKQKKQNKVMG